MTAKSFNDLAKGIADLVTEKEKAYGSAFDKAGDFLRVLYPNGIKPDQYKDMLCIIRVFDKLMRIATSYEGTEEKKVDAYSDLAGYGFLGLRASLQEQEAIKQTAKEKQLKEEGFNPEQAARWKDILNKAEKDPLRSTSQSLLHTMNPSDRFAFEEYMKKVSTEVEKEVLSKYLLKVEPKEIDEK